MEDATTRYGRLSFSIAATSSNSYTVNVTTAKPGFAPPGGVKLRVRSPSFLHGSKISQVTVGGRPWGQYNASEETILFKSVTDEMQHIIVAFAAQDVAMVAGPLERTAGMKTHDSWDRPVRPLPPAVAKSDDISAQIRSCSAGNASAVIVSGAGSASVNGRYAAVGGACTGPYQSVKFMKDASHTIYTFEDQWRIAEPSVKIWYEAAKGSQLGDRQPWLRSATDAGVAPPPQSVVCEPCPTLPCPRPAPKPCPPPPPPPINPECTGVIGYRSSSGSPHGPWVGPTLLVGTTPSNAGGWTGAAGVDNPTILVGVNGTNVLLAGRSCGGKVERPFVATAPSWAGPFESIDKNGSQLFPMFNAEE